MADGYAVVGLDDADWSATSGGVDHARLTDALGATQVDVEAYRLLAAEGIDVPAARETLLVPLDAAGPLAVDGTTLPAFGLARVPAGAEATVESDTAATVLAVGAIAEPEPDAAPIAVGLDDAAFVVPGTSDVATAFLTEPLGCTGVKANARRLAPGQAVPYHTEGDQEELFVPVRGPASMRIAGERFDTPRGTVARVAPEVPRSAVNPGGADAVWVMVGAPPTGGPRDWDPGAVILE